MKRIWVLFLAFCTVTLSCVCMLTPGATGANTDIWSVYSMMGDEDGNIFFGTAPSFAYTDEGLRVVPFEEIESYTVQTDHAYSVDDGLYMEIKLDQPAEAGMLVFHLWDQSGFLLSGLNCGSGWQGMLQLNPSETQYMVSTFVHGATASEEGQAIVLGSVKLSVPVAEDGSVSYSIRLKDGALQINGRAVTGAEKALAMLREKRDDGSVYLGVSIAMSEAGGLIPLTVARFGTSPENASVPGADGQLPETGEEAPETVPPTPPETTHPAPPETTPPAEQETEDDGPQTTPDDGQGTTPAETVPGESMSDTEPAGTVNPEPDAPYGDPETEHETRKEIHNEQVDNFMEKLENMNQGCTSAIGAGGLGCLSLLAAAYLGLRKRS